MNSSQIVHVHICNKYTINTLKATIAWQPEAKSLAGYFMFQFLTAAGDKDFIHTLY